MDVPFCFEDFEDDSDDVDFGLDFDDDFVPLSLDGDDDDDILSLSLEDGGDFLSLSFVDEDFVPFSFDDDADFEVPRERELFEELLEERSPSDFDAFFVVFGSELRLLEECEEDEEERFEL